ncbi:hypothetical protein [Longitalea luteola]|uniref:hypothetical protein n=1 Tax=Longitalea luteola TaxID=2812563 RepID=UPI001A97CB1E|nr:hypothetical protein [Longitalea luteola]
MKTYNHHPQWRNQPLRLTEEQGQDPRPVLDDFFQCYHLNDVRQILWEWLTEVLCSQRINEPLERNNHIYFYEKVEFVIEAAYVICKGPDHQIKKNFRSENVIQVAETRENESDLIKPKQLIEYVDSDPFYVIKEVFKNESLPFLRNQLRDWLRVALSADCSIYEEGEQRKQLLSFQDQLMILVEALFVIYNKNRENANVETQISETDKPRLLNQDQIENPMQVITEFFEKFPIVYVSRELNDWLEAGICYAGTYPDNMSELQALYTYRNVLCLIKSAHRLIYPIKA